MVPMSDRSESIPTGLEPGLGKYLRDQVSGSEPALGGDRRVDPQTLDDLSSGKWASVERLRRVNRHLTPDERYRYARALIARLDAPDSAMSGTRARGPILLALGVLGYEAALPRLIAALRSDVYLIQRAAIRGLGLLGHQDGIMPLLDLLAEYEADRTSVNPFLVIDALGWLGGAMPDLVVPRLLNLLQSAVWPDLKLMVLIALGRIKDVRAVDALIHVLQTHGDFRHRREAVRALAGLEHASVVPVLNQALADRYRDVRYAAALALGKLGDKRAAEPIRVAYAAEPVRQVRIGMERALTALETQIPDARNPAPLSWFGGFWYPDSTSPDA